MEKSEITKKLLEYLFPVAIIIVAVVLYVFAPTIKDFVARHIVGWKGGVLLLVAGYLLGAYYALVMGFRGKALAYAIFVIIFTFTCIWLAVNFDMVWDWLVASIGIWGTIGIVLVLCALVGLGMMLL